MGEKFYGTIEELKAKFASIQGEWTEQPGKISFRSQRGGIMNYWASKGTIQFQGKEDVRRDLEEIYHTDASTLKNQHSPQKAQNIFIVHGHDSEAKDQLELCLHRMGLTPFAIMNNAGSGQTLIEALEGSIGKDFVSGYGIVLMTPDDMGYAQKDGQNAVEPRARQNVILEMGMLLASLTRKRMLVIIKGHLELPSDIEGLIRVHYNAHIKEIAGKVAQNLQNAGFTIPAEKIAAAMN